MQEALAVVERLERIETLTRAGADPPALLAELRRLLAEAEAWSRVEGGKAAERAVAGLRSALERSDGGCSQTTASAEPEDVARALARAPSARVGLVAAPVPGSHRASGA